MTQPPVVIKVGGSVLTDKKRTDKIVIRDEVIGYVASEIRSLLDAGVRVALIHGVGSVGHLPVKKYELYKGITREDQLIKLTYTQNRVNELRQKFLNALEKHGVPAVKFYPSSLVVATKGRIVKFFGEGIKRFYEVGFVPVLSGDMVADTDDSLRLSVCSGDQLAFALADLLGSKRIVFGVDVDGVYDRNGNVVEKIKFSEIKQVLEGVGTGAAIDVTGGMRGKLMEITRHEDFFKRGGEVWILSLLKKGTLYRALIDGSGTFTRIVW